MELSIEKEKNVWCQSFEKFSSQAIKKEKFRVELSCVYRFANDDDGSEQQDDKRKRIGDREMKTPTKRE